MWKKDDATAPTPAYVPVPFPEAPPRPERPPIRTTGTAIIGRSITIRGDVTGDEDLLIQGKVDGSVNLRQHSVTVGADGEVKASINGRVVIVEGKVEGNISGGEQIVLRETAWVKGDIVAPRIVLEDGARLRGGVEMGDLPDGPEPASERAAVPSKRSPGTTSATPKASAGPAENGQDGSVAPAEATARDAGR